MSKDARQSTSLRPAARGLTRFNAHRQDRTTVHWFTWRHLRLKLEETPHYPSHGWTMLQLHVIAARDVPCPLTRTGYFAHFLDEIELAAAGGAVAFMTAWLDRDAALKPYKQAETRWRQGDLFDHAGVEESSDR